MKRLLVALVVATSLVLLASPCCGRALQADADKVLANKDFVESVSPKPDGKFQLHPFPPFPPTVSIILHMELD